MNDRGYDEHHGNCETDSTPGWVRALITVLSGIAIVVLAAQVTP